MIASDGVPAHDTTQAVAITVTDVNDIAPVFGSPTGSANVNEATSTATVVFDANATDADGTPANNTITYSLGGADLARFNINSATGEVTFAATPNFEAPADTGGDNDYDITVTASDGVPAHDATQTVTITVGNLAPAFDTPADGNPAANEVSNGSGAGAATGVDANATDPAGGTVTYALLDSSGAVADGGGRFTIDSSTGVVTAATTIVFDTSPSPINDYTISVRASDPSGAFSTQDFVITVTPNSPPSITAGDTITYVENDAPTVIDSTIVITDTDDTNMESAKVKISSGFVSGEDHLTFTPVGAINGSFVGDTLTLTGTGTIAEYEAVLESVKYSNSSEEPSGTDRIISYTVNDGAVDSAAATATVHVTPVNDAPVTTAGGTLNYTENQAATVIDSGVTATDVDSANLASATVAITGGFVNRPGRAGRQHHRHHHRQVVQHRHRRTDADRQRHQGALPAGAGFRHLFQQQRESVRRRPHRQLHRQ